MTDHRNYNSTKNATKFLCANCDHSDCDTCSLCNDPHQTSSVFIEREQPSPLPDHFLFQTKVNALVPNEIYCAERQDFCYIVSLPKIGEICRLTTDEIYRQISQKHYIIIRNNHNFRQTRK